MAPISALVLGILEGLTEFLPVSSTGHLIIGSYLLGVVQDDSFIVFEIAIQLGAILAVCVVYWRSMFNFPLLGKIIVGFLPTAIVGFTIFPYIKLLLTNEMIVAYMLIIGGGAIIFIEKWYAKIVSLQGTSNTQNAQLRTQISFRDALLLGCAQCLALVPGVSRSGAVMMSGLLMRLRREVVSEFAFLLAVPTMAAATAYTLLKHRDILTVDVLWPLVLGFVAAFFVALFVISAFLAYIRKYSFTPFGWYRIVLGLVLLVFIL